MSAHTIIRRIALALAATALAGALLPAQAQTKSRSGANGNPVVRITANGTDGETTFYGVRCVNGTRGDVRIEHEERQTCAVPQGGKTRCRGGWTIQQASNHVCTAGGR